MTHAKITWKPLLALLLVAVALVSFTSPRSSYGLDSFSVYLNDKLILKQAANQPISLQSLNLSQANSGDKLVVFYSQCNVDNKIGKSRSLTIKDARGRTIKEWKFADSMNGESKMTIPVKDLLQIEGALAHEELGLYYAAEGRTEGQKLMSMHLRS